MEQKQQIADRLKEANNILVTVSSNPSVDQLAACIGLTIALNKLGKHATAVFSGDVPSTIEFLQPEKTLEKDTNSLRDFIISLDKAKADKLRYKVEDKVVKIFITPYRTSISDKDLDFSQGDFNVDVVIALGVHNQVELDQAITSHGRILHDATVATINVKPGGDLGSMNWLEPKASSLSELVMELIDAVDVKLLDNQIATALLTGIVSETERFSNEKTTPTTMSISAELMAAGANQQLVATKLQEPIPVPEVKVIDASADETKPTGDEPAESAEAAPKPDDGTLEIAHAEMPEAQPEEHSEDKPKEPEAEPKDAPAEMPQEPSEPEDTPLRQIKIDEQGDLQNIEEMGGKHAGEGTIDPTQHMGGSRMILQPPTMGGHMNAGDMPADDGLATSSDPLSLPTPTDPFASASGPTPFAPPASAATAAPSIPYMPASMTPGAPLPGPVVPSPAPPPPTPTPEPPKPMPLGPQDPAAIAPFGLPSTPAPMAPTPELAPAPVQAAPVEPPAAPEPEPMPDGTHLDNARNAVLDAIASQPTPSRQEPIAALNAQPLGEPLHGPQPASQPPMPDLGVPSVPPVQPPPDLSVPAPASQLPPPQVPPPMMPSSPQ